MQRSIKKRVCLITASIVLFVTMSCAKDANSKNTVNSTDTLSGRVTDADTQKAFGKKEGNELRIYHQADWENGRVKIFWEPVQNARRYHVVCIRNEDSRKILEQDISAQEETAFAHEIEYGGKYKYEVWAYQGDNGNESVLNQGDYSLQIYPSPIDWHDGYEIKTTEGTTLVFFPCLKSDFNYISPTGIQIYRGKDKKHMKLVHTVKYEELSDFYPGGEYNYAKKYVDESSSHADYYQLRSYIDMDGKRQYGEKSKIKAFREEGYRGEVEARIKMKSKKPKIKNMEVIIKNTGKALIKVGMPYIKNYYKWGKFNKKYVFSLYDGVDDPDSSSNHLKIDKIGYKSDASEEYKTLSKNATVIIKPGEKIFLRFSRKNGQKFKNPFVCRDYIPWDKASLWGNQPVYMNLYLFQHMGEKAFISIYVNDSYVRMYKDVRGEPYIWDLLDD